MYIRVGQSPKFNAYQGTRCTEGVDEDKIGLTKEKVRES